MPEAAVRLTGEKLAYFVAPVRPVRCAATRGVSQCNAGRLIRGGPPLAPVSAQSQVARSGKRRHSNCRALGADIDEGARSQVPQEGYFHTAEAFDLERYEVRPTS